MKPAHIALLFFAIYGALLTGFIGGYWLASKGTIKMEAISERTILE